VTGGVGFMPLLYLERDRPSSRCNDGDAGNRTQPAFAHAFRLGTNLSAAHHRLEFSPQRGRTGTVSGVMVSPAQRVRVSEMALAGRGHLDMMSSRSRPNRPSHAPQR